MGQQEEKKSIHVKAINALLHEFLVEVYPNVGKAFACEAPMDSSCRKQFFGSRSMQSLLSCSLQRTPLHQAHPGSSSDDDEEPVRKPAAKKVSPKPAAKKAPIPDSSSDDDEEPVRKPAAKKAPIPDSSSDDDEESVRKPAAKKASIPDSSSDDDEEPVRKPAAKKVTPKPAAKKAPIPDSSSDDDEEPVRKAVGIKTIREDGEGEEERRDAVKTRRVENSFGVEAGKEEKVGTKKPAGEGTLKRFQRIDPTKVVFTAEELKDNRPGKEHLVVRQNQEMMRVKGKQFNKLKQKNKGKFYGAGVDTTVRSYQFPDSDSD